MKKNSTVSVRIDAKLKGEAESILKEIGMSTSKAITTFYKQIVLCKGIPFRLGLPYKMPKFLDEYSKEELEDEVLRTYFNSKKKDSKQYSVEEARKKLDEEFGF